MSRGRLGVAQGPQEERPDLAVLQGEVAGDDAGRQAEQDMRIIRERRTVESPILTQSLRSSRAVSVVEIAAAPIRRP